MKLLRLNLLRFGPFENHSLALDRGEHGLHIVFGPNEAGKTSALRALRQALYGIDHNSPDGFLHEYPDLRIGATIRAHDGRVVEFIRRKGQKNTLRCPDDETIFDPTELANCLIGVEDVDSFSKQFGIDYRELGEGGALVDQSHGSLRDLLFAAGAGVTDLARIERRLQAEAEEVFVPRGSKPRLNKACADYADAAKRLKQARLPAADWARLQEELENARVESGKLEGTLKDHRAEHERLSRFEQAIRLIAARRQSQDELLSVEDAVILPEGFGKLQLEAMTALNQAQSNEGAAIRELAALDQSLTEVKFPATLLDNGPSIEAIIQQLGAYKTAQKDLPGLISRRQLREADAVRVLRNVLQRDAELDEADALRLSPDQKVRLQELAQERGALATRSASAGQQVSALTRRQAQLAAQLGALPQPRDTGELERAIRRAQQRGDLAKRLDDAQRQLLAAKEHADIDLCRLPLWSGELEALERLPVPAGQTLEKFEQEFLSVEAEEKKVRERLVENQAELAECDRQLAELDLQHDVPSEIDLATARRRRDMGWQLVLQTWQTGRADEAALQGFLSDAPVVDLAGAYRHAVEQSDRIADRLRHEADRVSKKAGLLAARTKATSHQDNLQSQLARLEDRRSQLAARWTAAWQPLGIEPLSPREMRNWVDRHAKLSAASLSIRALEGQCEDLLAQIGEHAEELRGCLQRLGHAANDHDSIVGLLEFAESVLTDLHRQRDERKKLADELDRTRVELPEANDARGQAENELAKWQLHWAEEMGRLRLSPQATPAQALAVLAALDDLFDRRQQADALGERIDGIDKNKVQFVAAVQNLAERLAPDLQDESVERVIETLQARLNEGRDKRSRQDELAKKRAREERKQEAAQAEVRQACAALDALCQLAGCPSPEDLPAAEQRSIRRQTCERELRNLEGQLLALTSGIPLDEFLSQAQARDPAQLRPRQEQLDCDIDVAQRQQSDVNQKIGELNAQIRQLGAASPAEEIEEQKFDLVARIQQDAERFARLRLASVVLHKAMERYREKNQGPVLARAGEFFSDLTRGSFAGLRTDFDDSGNPIVRGVRGDGKSTVGVDGMSDGTKDQLYFALRLASLDHYLDHHPPFPFIVDDILIKFDDDRAVAALKALAQLSERTQVIFFTHHEHLVDLATKNLDHDVLVTHRLDCRAIPSPALAAGSTT